MPETTFMGRCLDCQTTIIYHDGGAGLNISIVEDHFPDDLIEMGVCEASGDYVFWQEG